MRGERLKKKENVIFVPLHLSYKRHLAIVFFFLDLPKWCVYVFIIGVSVCVCSTIVYHILFIPATLLDVCVLLSFASLYTYRLNYFNVTIGK